MSRTRIINPPVLVSDPLILFTFFPKVIVRPITQKSFGIMGLYRNVHQVNMITECFFNKRITTRALVQTFMGAGIVFESSSGIFFFSDDMYIFSLCNYVSQTPSYFHSTQIVFFFTIFHIFHCTNSSELL